VWAEEERLGWRGGAGGGRGGGDLHGRGCAIKRWETWCDGLRVATGEEECARPVGVEGSHFPLFEFEPGEISP
jgi:hypothetical protein